jgi:hypothetical protein
MFAETHPLLALAADSHTRALLAVWAYELDVADSHWRSHLHALTLLARPLWANMTENSVNAFDQNSILFWKDSHNLPLFPTVSPTQDPHGVPGLNLHFNFLLHFFHILYSKF